MNHQQMVKPILIGAAVLAVLGLAGLPVLTYLPFLIILACPLMMILMMAGMTHAGRHVHQHSRGVEGRGETP